ncbi:hypothetical protein OC835_001218 [Tilletia horrida]|nr:hypothetical protein OC835_001218 [Tilletia horrida]
MLADPEHPEQTSFSVSRSASEEFSGVKAFCSARPGKAQVSTLSQFQKRFDAFCNGILEGFHLGHGIFIYSLTMKDANRKVQELERVLRKNIADFDARMCVVRTPTTITFTPKHPDASNNARKVQVVLTIYSCLDQLLANFDLGLCAVAYDGQDVRMLPRAVRTIITGYIPVHDCVQGVSAGRLLKYVRRGFAVLVPQIIFQNKNGEECGPDVRSVFDTATAEIRQLHETMNPNEHVSTFISRAGLKPKDEWTHSLSSLARLAAVWHILQVDAMAEHILFATCKGSSRLYDSYHQTFPLNFVGDEVEYMSMFHQMDALDQWSDSDSDNPSTVGIQAGVPYAVGRTVAEVTKPLLVSVILPMGLASALKKSSRYSLKIKSRTRMTSDNEGIQLQVCDWTIHPAAMWNPGPMHPAAPTIQLLKKASMLTTWAARRIGQGAPWVDLQYGRTFQRLLQHEFPHGVGGELHLRRWYKT